MAPDGDPGWGVAGGQGAADGGVSVHSVHLPRHHPVKQTILVGKGKTFKSGVAGKMPYTYLERELQYVHSKRA